MDPSALPPYWTALATHWEEGDTIHVSEDRAAKGVVETLGPDLDQVVSSLIDALWDDSSWRNFMRLSAVKTLGWIGPGAHAAVPALLECLAGPRGTECPGAIYWTLGRIGPAARAAVPILKDALRREKAGTGTASIALISIEPNCPDAVRGLLEALDSGYVYYVPEVADRLAAVRPVVSAAIPGLAGYLTSIRGEVAATVARALLSMGGEDEQALDILVDSLCDVEDRERGVIVEGLLAAGVLPAAFLEKLRGRISDPRETPRGRLAALGALGRLDRRLAEATVASAGPSQATEFDGYAGKMLAQLKVFYLVYRICTERDASLREAGEILSGKHYRDLKAEGIPMTAASFSRNLKPLKRLFSTVFDDPSFDIYATQYKNRPGDSVKFSEGAQSAWEWTAAFLRRHPGVGDRWFGFSRLARPEQ